MRLTFLPDAPIGLDPIAKCWEFISVSIGSTGPLPMPDFDRSFVNLFLVAKGCHEDILFWHFFLSGLVDGLCL